MSVGQGAELQGWLDRQAILDLIYRYSDAVTRADFEQMTTVFAPDAVWESPLLELRFESARAFIDFQMEGAERAEVLVQTPHSPVIELLGAERAKATTTIHEFFRGTASNVSAYGDAGSELNVDQYGIYHDELAKLEGGWKFTRRRFEPFLIAPGRVVGDVVGNRPLLRPT
jgi:SnoaL-like domain